MRRIILIALVVLAIPATAQAITLRQARQTATQFAHHHFNGCGHFGRNFDCWYSTFNPPSNAAYTGGAWMVDVYVGHRGTMCSRDYGAHWVPCGRCQTYVVPVIISPPPRRVLEHETICGNTVTFP